MTDILAIQYIQRAIEDAKLAPLSSSFNDGYIMGLEAALVFLGDPEAIERHEADVKRILSEAKGEGA